MQMLLWMPLLAWLNCADRAVDPEPDEYDSEADTDDDGDDNCGYQDGEIIGQVMEAYPWGAVETPAPSAQIFAAPNSGEDTINLTTDDNGQFSLSLPADTYTVFATDGGSCESEPETIVVDPCDVIIKVFKLVECAAGDAGPS